MESKILIISKENFKKYGDVVKLKKSDTPTSQANDYKFWANIASYQIQGETEIGICTVFKQEENILEGMEKHISTPEILIPIDAPFVLPLLLEGEDDSSVKAFKVDLGEAVIINPGVWHGPCLPFEKDESSYFVIFKKFTPSGDVEKKTIIKTIIKF